VISRFHGNGIICSKQRSWLWQHAVLRYHC